MTNYPTSIDNDRTIVRIDDNLSELGSSAINQLREAVFAIERTLGVSPNGSKSSVNDRISILIGPDGNPRAEALQAIGLATLPISNAQVATNAGIQEIKLALDYSTSDLNTDIISIQSQLTIVQGLLSDADTNFLTHISGGVYLVDGITKARHVASHIDINAVGTDSRDTYSWTGLLDVDGNVRSATQVAAALLQINNELVAHENATTSLVHPASSIELDTSEFVQIPTDITNVQDAFGYLDEKETLSAGVDRATLHSNGIPKTARIQDLRQDGYTINIVPATKINTYLAAPSALAPNDNINNGDDVVQFRPENVNFDFDSKFTNVQAGDILRINYGDGIEATFSIVAVRFSAGVEWAVRVNSNNLFNDGYDGYARIDRPAFDTQTCGVFAVAGVVPNVVSSQSSINSVIIGSPRGASAVGIGFDAGQIDTTHYKLYLRFYPDGTPSVFYDLPAIDVSGNAGATPGYYNIDIVVEAINRGFRASGYNYRFIAFNYKGEFGIMLADDYNGAAFSIISGQLNYSTGTLEEGPYTLNVVGDAVGIYDALGLGFSKSGVATPVMSRLGVTVPYPTSIIASNYPTRIISPVGGRNVIINGNRRDTLARSSFTEGDGYWFAVVTNTVTDIPNNTIRITYSIALDLATEGLVSGKTIVVQPELSTTTTIKDYGRFVIESVSFSCDGSGQTNITVLNSIHGTANPNQASLAISTRVRIYFSDDSVMFNFGNMAGGDSANDPADYHHYHEVFINDVGKSVAIERARIPHANNGSIAALPGSGNIGALSEWRIRRVSPLLKGYRYGVTNFRYFIWLWIDNYNSITGEFDVYLFDLTWDNGGPLTRGRKNSPIRIYDESYVNFIDLEFREDASSPGTTIPTGWVAVELFSTLKENDEYFAIAGISHDGVNFKSVTDLREFGTISEKNFSDSAIQFIQSGERYLHANGVVRGFAYKGSGISNTLFFNGGIALVNGVFVPVDASPITIPSVTSVSGVVEHFICVTETGQLRTVVKNTGTPFFDSTNDNFVESLTFKDIVDNRKDLTIIAKAVVTAGSGVVVVTDARRHIVNQDLGTYTWTYSDSGSVSGTDVMFHGANFITAEALVNWVNEYNIDEVKVKTVTISSKLTLNFTSSVTLSGGVYYINSVQGLSFISGDWKIDNAEIIYNPTNGVYDTGDFFNTKSNWGAILIDLASILTSTISNFGVENSNFYSSIAQRPPFIGIYSATGVSENIFKNGRFINNTFTDDVADKGLCYAFVNGNLPTVSSSAPYFEDLLVSDTKVNSRQGMIISGRATPEAGMGYTSTTAVLVENVILKDNRFGFIGFNVSNGISRIETGRFIIENNKAEVIWSGITATMHPTTKTYGDITNGTTGNSVAFIVRNNNCNYMKIEASPGVNELKTNITDNYIKLYDDYIHAALIPDPVPWAMVVLSQGIYPTHITIANNIIDGWNGYLHGIYVSGAAASITGNIVNNIGTAGYGIWNSWTTQAEQSTIVGNTLNKADGIVIAGYIYSTSNAAIYGNTLSHANLAFWSDGGTEVLDGYGDTTTSNFNGIIGTGAQFAAWNVNQVVRTVPNIASAIPLFHISPVSGTVVSGVDENNERLLYGMVSGGQYINKGLQKVSFTENNGWVWRWVGGGVDLNDGTVGLIIPLVSVLPDRAYLLSVSVHVYFSGQWDITDNSHTPVHTTFPQVSLELNGNMVDSRNPFNDPHADPSYTDVTLNYQSEALITGTRPAAPLIKEMVVKMRQGEPSDGLVYGGWLGPTGVGSQTMRIGQVWISYMY